MPKLLFTTTVISLLFLMATGCSKSSMLSLYIPTIHQGNYIDKFTISQLHTGMTKNQVQHILGSPLIVDPFHQERWDYYYQCSRGTEVTENRRITLYFNGDILDHIDSSMENS
jgi:outer membrane protein assembly factor BamE